MTARGYAPRKHFRDFLLKTISSFFIFTLLALPASGQSSPPPGTAQQPPASPATPPAFEAATIKPVKNPDPNRMYDRREGRRFFTHNTTLSDLILMAYHLDRQQIASAPVWATTEEYDVDAVADSDAQLADQKEEMLQQLLAERFQLKFHWEQRQVSAYVLVVAKSGPKLNPASTTNGRQGASCEHLGMCTFRSDSLQHFSRWLSFVVLDRPVQDKTGLTGNFDFTLRWTPDESQFSGMGIRAPQPTGDTNAPPDLVTAIQEQLGLKLEPVKTLTDVLVIDHIERPSEN